MDYLLVQILQQFLQLDIGELFLMDRLLRLNFPVMKFITLEELRLLIKGILV